MFEPKRKKNGPPSFVIKDMERIHAMLNGEFGFNIMDGGRKRVYVDARKIFANVLDAKYDLKISKPYKMLTLNDVGDYIGCNHATVINLLRNFDVLCSWDPRYQEIYDRVLAQSSEDYVIKVESLTLRKKELEEELERVNQQLKLLANGEERQGSSEITQ